MRTTHGHLRRLAGALALCSILAGATAAQAAVGALRLSEGATLSSPVDAAFHDVGEDGLTIEGWFYLDRVPDVGQVQTFFAHSASYALGVGIARGRELDEFYDPTQARAFIGVAAEGWGVQGQHWFPPESGRNAPVGEWFHVALQFHAEPPTGVAVYLAGYGGGPLAGDFPFTLGGDAAALDIGTASAQLGIGGFDVEPDTTITRLLGLVDEVRVSNVARYEGREAIAPRSFVPDEHTVALWTFDGDRPYADSSGAGHHLMHTGTITVEPLAVRARDKLTTTWAQLRSVGH